MKANVKLMAMAAVSMLAMTACESDDVLGSGNGSKMSQVAFEMGINPVTRTSTPDDGNATTFVAGDEVGIFVNDSKNVKYSASAGESSLTWDGEAIKIAQDVEAKFYAYYPYAAANTDAANVAVSVAADQTVADDYAKSDVLYAAATATPTEATADVTLNYKHAFSLVQVELTGSKAKESAVVTLKNVKTAGTLDLTAASPTTTLTDNTGDVKMKTCTATTAGTYKYRAVVPAQTIAAGTSILTVVVDGVEYDYKYNVNVPYNQGKCRQYNVTLGETPAECTIKVVNSDIANWEGDDAIEGGDGTITENVPGQFVFEGKDAIGTATKSSTYGTISWDDESGTLLATFGLGKDDAANTNVNITFDNFNQTISAENSPILAVLIDYADGVAGMKAPKYELTVNGVIYTYENIPIKDYTTGKYVAYLNLSTANPVVREGVDTQALKTGTHTVTKFVLKNDRKTGDKANQFGVRAIKTYKSESDMNAALGIE